MARILLTYSPEARALYYRDAPLAALRALGDVVLKAGEAPYDAAGLIADARDCAIIVSDRHAAGPRAVFAALPRLVAFIRGAVDIRNIDVEAASEHGVLVAHSMPSFVNAVAEWVIGAMIDLARHMSALASAFRAGSPPPLRMGRELRGATLGIIGYGAIGQRVGDIAQALGLRVIVASPHTALTHPQMPHVGLAALLAEADFVVCLAASTPATDNLLDAQAFAAMKPTAYFINASRGELVDEAALLAALDAGTIAGCAMDVGRAPQQMPSPALARHPHVIATPHIGGLTPEAVDQQALLTVDQVRAILSGVVPAQALNAERATRWRN